MAKPAKQHPDAGAEVPASMGVLLEKQAMACQQANNLPAYGYLMRVATAAGVLKTACADARQALPADLAGVVETLHKLL